ncbi:MAG: hypothetical protein RSD88_06955 [Anaerovoracaceae bacterium]
MNNYKQETFPCAVMETINNKANKIRKYERKKAILLMDCTSCQELEKELIKLTKELKL